MRWPPVNRFAWVVLALSLVAVAMTAVSGWQSHARAQCQARVNQQLVMALRARAESVDARDTAFDQMLDALLTAKSPEERRATLATYRAAQAQVAADRREHPLPAPPDETCG
jgi:hypothetical protein